MVSYASVWSYNHQHLEHGLCVQLPRFPFLPGKVANTNCEWLPQQSRRLPLPQAQVIIKVNYVPKILVYKKSYNMIQGQVSYSLLLHWAAQQFCHSQSINLNKKCTWNKDDPKMSCAGSLPSTRTSTLWSTGEHQRWTGPVGAWQRAGGGPTSVVRTTTQDCSKR